MNSRAATTMDDELAFIRYKRNAWGEIDYEYYKKIKEEKQKKLNRED